MQFGMDKKHPRTPGLKFLWRSILHGIQDQRQLVRNPLLVVFLVWGAMFLLSAMIFSFPESGTFQSPQDPPSSNAQSSPNNAISNQTREPSANPKIETVEIFSAGVDTVRPQPLTMTEEAARMRVQQHRSRVASAHRTARQTSSE